MNNVTLDLLDASTIQPVQFPMAAWMGDMIESHRLGEDEKEKMRAASILQQLVDEVLHGSIVVSNSLLAGIERRIAEIDEALSAQMDAVLHHPDFQALESSWRGLHDLIQRAETGSLLSIMLIDAKKSELVRDFKIATEFDQSALFKKIYEHEYGTLGGLPFAALLADYDFSRAHEDLFLLEQLSHVAAAAHAPLIAAAAPSLFGLESFTDLLKPRDLAKIFETSEYTKWRSFRETEDARYCALVLPHVLGRIPYAPGENSVEKFHYCESQGKLEHDDLLWVRAIYAYASNLTRAFSQYGWLAAIRGVEGGGIVEQLPCIQYFAGEGALVLQCPTEVAVTDRLEKQLSDLGFIGLVHCKHTDYAAFLSGQSVQKPGRYVSEAANANARLAAQLPYIFAVSRIAHYLKAIVRDKIGSFSSRDALQAYLNQWLSQYVLLDDSASQEAKARYPLREARVDVLDKPGEPGAYRAAVFLRPHFQLDELSISLRLVSDFGKR